MLGVDSVIFICGELHAFEASTLYIKLTFDPTSYHGGMNNLSIPLPLFDRVVAGVNLNIRALSAFLYPRISDEEVTEQFSTSISPGRTV